ncbi:hypothetical protein Tco_0585486 [Tanacetum coccineum]
MDSIISLGQKNTLAEYMITSGADIVSPYVLDTRTVLSIWPTVEEKRTLINDMNIYKMIMKQFQVNTKFLNRLLPEWSKFVTDVKLVKDLHTSNFDQLHAYLEQHELHANEVQTHGFVVPVFSPGDDPIACLNKAIAFLTAVASSRGEKGKVILVKHIRAMLLVQGEIQQVDTLELLNAITAKVKDIWLGNALSQSDQGMLHDCDDLLTAQAVLMANISNYGSDIILEVPNFETYLNDMDNQSVHALQDFKQTPVMDFTNNKISSDSNIILYSQYFCQEIMIDSQMDDMIREKLALKDQIDSLEQNLSKQIKEKESLFKTFIIFKNESKEKENKYIKNEIDLEKKIKELDNIICKVGQSAQTVHMLTKPQAFYDNTHKQALGYQNPFYLMKAQRLKPTLYDGVVLSNTHVAMPVIDEEEILILEEESRSKMFEKAKDPEVIAKKIS